MRISDTVLRAHLRNVYWVAGAACGGKTTIADHLAERHGFMAYHPEERYDEHKSLANPIEHPCMLEPFRGWDRYFGRSVDEYASAIINADRERFEMVLVDVIKLSQGQTVVVDAHALDPEIADRLTTPDRVVFLFAESGLIREINFQRDDKADILGVINTLPDPDATREHVLDVVCETSDRKLNQVVGTPYRHFIRGGSTSLEQTLSQVEMHLGLPRPPDGKQDLSGANRQV